MKKRITQDDYIKANRKASREAEIEMYGHPICHKRVHPLSAGVWQLSFHPRQRHQREYKSPSHDTSGSLPARHQYKVCILT